MADSLANMAIDSTKSQQALIREEEVHDTRWVNLSQLADGDMGHWALTHGEREE
jgi:hypothetical protein